MNGIQFFYESDNKVTAMYRRSENQINEIINLIKNSGMEIIDISTEEGDLEDVFIDATKS